MDPPQQKRVDEIVIDQNQEFCTLLLFVVKWRNIIGLHWKRAPKGKPSFSCNVNSSFTLPLFPSRHWKSFPCIYFEIVVHITFTISELLMSVKQRSTSQRKAQRDPLYSLFKHWRSVIKKWTRTTITAIKWETSSAHCSLKGCQQIYCQGYTADKRLFSFKRSVFILQITAWHKSLLIYMGLKWGITLLISVPIIPSISLNFLVAWHGKQPNRTNAIPSIRKDGVSRGIRDKSKQLVLKRRITWIFSLEKFRIGTKLFSRTQSFSIHFNILENASSKWFVG